MAEEPSFADLADTLSLGLPFRVRKPAGESQARFVHVGARCEAMLGVPAEALLRSPDAFLDLLIADDRHRLLAEAADARGRGAPLSVDLRMRDASGEIRWRNLRAAPRPARDGGYQWDGLMLDITEGRRLAEQLEAERRRLEEAIELAGMGVFQWRRSEPDALIWSDHQYEIYGVAPGTPMSVERGSSP